jgi:hypothetical protein
MHAIIAFFRLFDYISDLRVNHDVSPQYPTLNSLMTRCRKRIEMKMGELAISCV